MARDFEVARDGAADEFHFGFVAASFDEGNHRFEKAPAEQAIARLRVGQALTEEHGDDADGYDVAVTAPERNITRKIARSDKKIGLLFLK